MLRPEKGCTAVGQAGNDHIRIAGQNSQHCNVEGVAPQHEHGCGVYCHADPGWLYVSQGFGGQDLDDGQKPLGHVRRGPRQGARHDSAVDQVECLETGSSCRQCKANE